MGASPVVVSGTESEEAGMHTLVHQGQSEVLRSRFTRLEVASCDDTASRVALPIRNPMVLNAERKDASNVGSEPSEGVRVVSLNEAEGRVDPSEGRCLEIGITKNRCSKAMKIPVRGPAPDRVDESPADEIACT